MYLYNTTFVVDHAAEEKWRQWMQRTLLPNIADVVPSARMELYELDNRLEHTPGCSTYSLQYQCDSVATLRTVDDYTQKIVAQPDGPSSLGVVYFSSMMKKITL